MDNKRQYSERDIVELDKNGEYYSRHVSAMTSEQLHSKSAIAAELAYRDRQIDILKNALNEIANHTQDAGLLWWQKIARKALEAYN